MRSFPALMAASLAAILAPAATAQELEIPAFARAVPEVKSGEPLLKFNGRDLTGFYVYTKTNKFEDPQKVFTVQDGVLRISGEDFGGMSTGGNFSDYHLVTEWRWGEKTWDKRAKAARDSGILLHCIGPDGAWGGQWMESIECQLIEGGCGDFLVLNLRGTPRMTSATRTGPDKQPYFDPGSPATERLKGRINWWGRDPAWKDVIDTPEKYGVEKPRGQWNRTEVICDGDRIVVLMNGILVNEGTKVAPTEGKIQFQSEGAELFFRKIEVRPLIKPDAAKPAK
ncbi:3-keto-disaccharide hydrolase [Tundrisphaera sp. TA3]|uniref:3-keto-disaccharide hydrolase n=1 Tax=Tundrisphaera sp. TA3 TaxID=3435775 RepID=UPI003EB7BC6F